MSVIKTTLIGGIFFLIPLAFLLFVLGQAFGFARKLAKGVDIVFPMETVGGAALIDLLAVVFLLILCFVAGLAARLAFIRRRVDRLDGLLVELVPGYAVAKSTVSGVAGHEPTAELLKTVLVTFDDQQQLAFEVERVGGKVIVFLPGAPSAWSGATVMVEEDRVQPLDLPVHQVTGLLRVLGRGTAAALAAARSGGNKPAGGP